MACGKVRVLLDWRGFLSPMISACSIDMGKSQQGPPEDDISSIFEALTELGTSPHYWPLLIS